MGQDVSGIGYLALPETANGLGVLVIQEWWGIVPHIKAVTERFAQAGFVALAPDLYNGETTTSPDQAGRMLMALNIEQAAKDLESAINYLLEQPAVTQKRLGVVGFCMGGQLALLAGTLSRQIGAVVDFYGIHPNVHPDFSQLTAPVLGIFGEQDQSVPPQVVDQLAAQIRQANQSIETHIYPNADHAFFNDTRPEVYNSQAAADAWQRTLNFLQHHLHPA